MEEKQEVVRIWSPARFALLVTVAFGAMGTAMGLMKPWLGSMINVLDGGGSRPQVSAQFVLFCIIAIMAGAVVCWLCSKGWDAIERSESNDDSDCNTYGEYGDTEGIGLRPETPKLKVVDVPCWWQAALTGLVIWALMFVAAANVEWAFKPIIAAIELLVITSWILVLGVLVTWALAHFFGDRVFEA